MAIILLIATAIATTALAQTWTVDQSASTGLTSYLHKNRLPLVGAQVSNDSSGNQRVMLYGFVATERGRSDAETRSRHFLKNDDLEITNSIKVDPQIRTLHKPTFGQQNLFPSSPDSP